MSEVTKLRVQKVNVIECHDWDALVESTYRRRYCFQQQDDCKDRGMFSLTVPLDTRDDYDGINTIPEIVNVPEMGVSFSTWLSRDPEQPLEGRPDGDGLCLWWVRNFYPDIQMVANDLYKKGLVEAGEYEIRVDW
jgi:hypothetical protein